jgi:hypothetical protein
MDAKDAIRRVLDGEEPVEVKARRGGAWSRTTARLTVSCTYATAGASGRS